MSRYIDADKLKKSIRISGKNAEELKKWIDAQKPADVVHVVHARWEWVTKDIYYCTECNRKASVEEYMEKPIWDYCPNCGAKMDKDMRGEQDE